MHKKEIGAAGEMEAIAYLLSHGYRIEARNYRYQRGEIDIIARKNQMLIFIEVKTRSSTQYGTPESFLSHAQAERYHEVATHYIEENKWSGRIRFDIIAIEHSAQQKGNSLLHLKDAF